MYQLYLFHTRHTHTPNFSSTKNCREISEVSIPNVKREILLLSHPKIYEVFRISFWKTVKIKYDICFSWVFNVSQGPLSNAKESFSLAPSVSELLQFFPVIPYFEIDNSNHDTTLIILKLITETSEKETFFVPKWYMM